MKKNAFTLMELLAVIALLAIIAIIVTPTIINSLQNARQNAFKDDVTMLVKAANNYYNESNITADIMVPLMTTYTAGQKTQFTKQTNGSCQSVNEGLEYSGKGPDSGQIYIDQNGNVELKLYSKTVNKCAVKGLNDKDIKLEDIAQSACTLGRSC